MPNIPDNTTVRCGNNRVAYGSLPIGARYQRFDDKHVFVVSEKREYLADWYAGKKAEFYSHVRPGYKALAERPERISHEEYTKTVEEHGANSYEHRLLVQNLDDEAVCKIAEYCMSQSGRELGEFNLAEHYGDAVQREFAPLLVKRLRDLHEKIKKLPRVIVDKDDGEEIEVVGGEYIRVEDLERVMR